MLLVGRPQVNWALPTPRAEACSNCASSAVSRQPPAASRQPPAQKLYRSGKASSVTPVRRLITGQGVGRRVQSAIGIWGKRLFPASAELPIDDEDRVRDVETAIVVHVGSLAADEVEVTVEEVPDGEDRIGDVESAVAIGVAALEVLVHGGGGEDQTERGLPRGIAGYRDLLAADDEDVLDRATAPEDGAREGQVGRAVRLPRLDPDRCLDRQELEVAGLPRRHRERVVRRIKADDHPYRYALDRPVGALVERLEVVRTEVGPDAPVQRGGVTARGQVGHLEERRIELQSVGPALDLSGRR